MTVVPVAALPFDLRRCFSRNSRGVPWRLSGQHIAGINRAPNVTISAKPSADSHGMTVHERVALARLEVAALGMRLEVGGPRARFNLEGIERFVADPRFRSRAILYGRILEEFRGTAFALVNAV